MTDDRNFRAAYWVDGNADLQLTGEEDKDLPDDELLAKAKGLFLEQGGDGYR
jgi:hypothetical protein